MALAPSAVGIAFDHAQKTVAAHDKYIISLQRERQQSPEEFKQEFISKIDSILVVFTREPAAERLVKFVTNFVAVDENGEVDSAFAVGLLEHLRAHVNAKDKAVRLRTSQLIAAILGSVAEKLEISDELWEQISEVMLLRSKDKVPSVRAAACFGLSFFQDPEDEEDDVIGELMHMMSTDASKDVRKTALQHIAVTKRTLPCILGRLRDNKDELRKFIFQVIAWKIPIKKLNMTQRCQVLEAGLHDRNEQVRKSCVTMLCDTWLKDNLDSDPIKLLASLDVEINETVAVSTLNAIFTCLKTSGQSIKNGPLAWDQLFAAKLAAAAADTDSAGIGCELALYLRVRCQWCKSQRPNLEGLIDDLLVDLSSLSDLIGYHYQQARDGHAAEVYITRQLLQCATMADLSDEAGRRSLVETIRSMFTDIETDSLIVAALGALKIAVPDEDAYIRMVVELISDLREPLDDIPAVAITEKDIASVELALVERTSLVERTWMRCLSMASYLLEHTQKKLNNGELQGLEESLLLPAVQHRESQIRDRGVLALGQYCLLDKDVAQRYLILFLQALKNDMEPIQHTAM
jgi:condensin complex subunit 3